MDINETELAELRRKADILERTKEYIDSFYAEEDELRRKATLWEKVEKLYPNVAAYITNPDEYTRKRKALKEPT